MFDAVLDTLGNIVDAFPIESAAVIAVLVGAGGLIVTGWKQLITGISGFFSAIGAVVGAIGAFFGALINAFGTTIGGLIILVMGGMAVWWVLVVLSGG